jgi:hypothetical protein
VRAGLFVGVTLRVQDWEAETVQEWVSRGAALAVCVRVPDRDGLEAGQPMGLMQK